MPKRSAITPEDLYRFQVPSQLSLSPGGDRLVFAVKRADRETLTNRSSLWWAALGGDETARPFTQGNHADGSPRWAPDGRSIAFVSDRSGKSEIWIIPSDGGEARQLTRLSGRIGEFTWHPSGRSLIFAFTPRDQEAKEREEKKKRGEPGADAPRVRHISRLHYKLDGAGFLPEGRSHLWSVDLETGRTRQLTSDDAFDEGEPRVSPDGRWVYFTSNRTADPDRELQRVHLWRVPVRGGKVERIRSFDGPAAAPSVSPDGEWIAFIGKASADEPVNMRHERLWVVSSRGGRPIELSAALDRSIGHSTISDTSGVGQSVSPVWSPDSRWLYFQVTNEGNTEIWRAGLERRKPEPVFQAPGVALDFVIDFSAGWIHTAFSSLENPGEVRSDPLPPPGRPPILGDRKPTLKTALNTALLSERRLATPREIWFEGPSRNRVQGWILEPPGVNRARKHPGVLYIHGGPATQYGRAFFHEFQFLAAQGYVVFYCNPRGGTGYSERHLNAIVDRWGTRDFDDLMAFTDAVLKKTRHLDRRRLAVAGGSYGGFMTNWIIGHTQRFACAVTQRSISNLMSFVGSSDFGFYWPAEFGTAGPWENPKHYLAQSPLTYLAAMKTPLLIEHQEEDHRCPIEQAEQLWAALRAKGVPCEFLRYPGEPHGMSRDGRPDRRIDRLERTLAWLARWLRA